MNLVGMGLGGIILIVGGVLLKPCIFFWRTQRRLRLHGITIHASVTYRHLEHLSNGQPWYFLTCHYTYEGQSYVSDRPIWRDLYESEAGRVSLCCLPGTPEIASVCNDNFERVEWAQKTVLALVFCLLGMFLLGGSSLLF